MRDEAQPTLSHPNRKPDAFYVVLLAHTNGPYSPEFDSVSAPVDAQWREIVENVATMQWEDVVACYRVDAKNGRCDDCLIRLANAVDHWHWQRGEDPHEDVRNWIEGITGDDAFETEAHKRERIESQRVDYAIDLARGK